MKNMSPDIMKILVMLALLLPLGVSGRTYSGSGFQDKTMKLNPNYKVNRLPKGAVLVSGISAEGTEIKHEFKDFYADLIMAAYRKQSLVNVENNLQKKYYLSEDDCRRELKHALNVLTEWNIILVNDRL
jgi:hypothetical protein